MRVRAPRVRPVTTSTGKGDRRGQRPRAGGRRAAATATGAVGSDRAAREPSWFEAVTRERSRAPASRPVIT